MYDNFDECNHDQRYDRAIWHTLNGDIPVMIIAYSLGALRAFCVVGIEASNDLRTLSDCVLTAGNYAATWLPVSKLTIPVSNRSIRNANVS